MHSEPLVTVVVPVYKVEQYIHECVDSILRQTYKNFELYLVDDGSPDNCGQICDQYQEKDSRVHVIHKENGGLSDARNAAINLSKGEYITFIDSDDYVADFYLESLVSAAISFQADIVQGCYTRENNDFKHFTTDDSIVFSDHEKALRSYLLYKDIQGYACVKLYRTELFDGVRYPIGRIQEDACTTYKLIWKAKNVICIPDIIYYYRVNNESIMNGSFNPKRFDIITVPDDIRNYLGSDQYKFEKEIDYYTMRAAIKTYHDCIQKKCEKQLKKQMDDTRRIIISLKRDKKLWERKYIFLQILIHCLPNTYTYLVQKLR